MTTTNAFQVTTGAGGGTCGPSSFSPGFEAGTLAPLAGSYSPFVFNLSRAVGAPRLSSIEATLPQGCPAKLAGVTECPEAQIAAARTRSGPNQGAPELASPSCPASSQVGTVTVGAGSGAQIYVQGKAYLAGPYKGAPLSPGGHHPGRRRPLRPRHASSSATPSTSTRTTAQIRAVSDPLPVDPRRDPARHPLDLDQPATGRIHPEPDLLRPDGGHRPGDLAPRPDGAPCRAASRSAAARASTSPRSSP